MNRRNLTSLQVRKGKLVPIIIFVRHSHELLGRGLLTRHHIPYNTIIANTSQGFYHRITERTALVVLK